MRNCAIILLLAAFASPTVGDTDAEVVFNLTWQDIVFVKLSHHEEKVLIELEMTDDATARFSEMTRTNIGRHVTMQFNGSFVNRPLVRTHILGGSMVIEMANITEALDTLSLLGRRQGNGDGEQLGTEK
jgi:hypothetical protein